MAALVCEICGGKLMGKPGGIFECDSCGMEYSTDWAKAKIQEIKGTVQVEGTVEVQGTVKVEGPVKVEGAASAQSLLRRGNMALEDRNWDDAIKCFEQVLDIDPECGAAYFGRAMAEVRGVIERLAEKCVDGDTPGIRRARQFADEATAIKLKELDVAIAEYRAYIEEFMAEEHRQREAEEEEHRRLLQEQERVRQAQIERYEALRTRYSELFIQAQRMKHTLAAGSYHSVGLTSNGKVLAAGGNAWAQLDVASGSGVVAVSSSNYHTACLRSDGTVYTAGKKTSRQNNVGEWKNIIELATGDEHTVGLCSDGTVLCAGSNKFGQCSISEWKDIVAISACDYHTVGLRADGTLIATGKNDFGQCNVSGWRDVVAISSGGKYTLGLRSDGTVLCTKNIKDGHCDVSGWKDIVAISAGYDHVLGLKIDGTVVAAGNKKDGQCSVSTWINVVAISAGYKFSLGLTENGYVRGRGANSSDALNVHSWNMGKLAAFQKRWESLEEAKKERIQKERASLKTEKETLLNELPTLKGIFAGKRRKEIEARLAEIEKELKALGE